MQSCAIDLRLAVATINYLLVSESRSAPSVIVFNVHGSSPQPKANCRSPTKVQALTKKELTLHKVVHFLRWMGEQSEAIISLPVTSHVLPMMIYQI